MPLPNNRAPHGTFVIWAYKVPHHKTSVSLAEEEHLAHDLKDSKPAGWNPQALFSRSSTALKNILLFPLFNIKQTCQSSVSQLLLKFVWWQEIGQMTSWALWLAQLCELALQEHSGNTKSLLLVERLSQDVVVSDTLEARLLTQLAQKLWKRKQRA